MRPDVLGAALEQGRALLHAEPVLLIDDDQPQVGELHLVVEQSVGTDGDPSLSAHDLQQGILAGRAVLGAGQQHNLSAPRVTGQHARLRKLPKHGRDAGEVLLRQRLGGRQQHRLPATVDHSGHGQQRHQRLSCSDFTVQQPLHGRRGRQVRSNRRDGVLLPLRERE